MELTLTVEEAGPGACRQVLQGRMRVHILGVGRVVEGKLRDKLAATYRSLPAMVEKWQVVRGELLAQGGAAELLRGRPPVGRSVGWIRRADPACGDSDEATAAEGAAAVEGAAAAEPAAAEDGDSAGALPAAAPEGRVWAAKDGAAVPGVHVVAAGAQPSPRVEGHEKKQGGYRWLGCLAPRRAGGNE